jgi:hydrogenase/urease accessory protein HupE
MLTIGCLAATRISAHAINYALEKAPTADVAWFYLRLGVKHIIPGGIDHILFITALCLIATKWKAILWQATAFTVAHSITLTLSMKNIITVPSEIVEPVIALSIAFVAIENILLTVIKAWRILVIFGFGLIHGLGFASSLNETGLPRNQFYTSIIFFNGGVELAQIALITALFMLIILPFGDKMWYRKFIVYPFSALIAVIAVYWTIERLM